MEWLDELTLIAETTAENRVNKNGFAVKPEESGSETSPWQLSWKDDGAYTTWLTAMKERSAVESDVTVTCSDKVLTLSTCTPGGTGRFLVMGKLVKVDNEI